MEILGLTNPYRGDKPCSRAFRHGFTFRWVKGDRYVAVMRGFCVDARRYLILHDHLAGHQVHEKPQPLVDAISAPPDEWWDNALLRHIADSWVNGRSHLRRTG
ncbi:hypothetical protein [Actinokineospora xionganensis]|uniref:Uncharacterized protein n=1 Tax=Actinokineospora xionganensis TaxID=2684470 RepID=A0ABR7L8D8_9PSEU|nr:hypothetical protein [Actinokineospora xionganensis]MBC6448818.1 hypothetical protein [Actinokineospora xionganensis]